MTITTVQDLRHAPEDDGALSQPNRRLTPLAPSATRALRVQLRRNVLAAESFERDLRRRLEAELAPHLCVLLSDVLALEAELWDALGNAQQLR